MRPAIFAASALLLVGCSSVDQSPEQSACRYVKANVHMGDTVKDVETTLRAQAFWFEFDERSHSILGDSPGKMHAIGIVPAFLFKGVTGYCYVRIALSKARTVSALKATVIHTDYVP